LIASAIEEQQSVSEDINRHIFMIKDASEVAAECSEQTSGASEALQQLAGRLCNLVSQFKV